MSYLTTIFANSPFKIEHTANFFLRPLWHFLDQTRKVEILSIEDKKACHSAKVDEGYHFGKTVVMAFLAIPSFLIGVPLKLFSVFCCHTEQERTLILKAITHLKSSSAFYSEDAEVLEVVKTTYKVLTLLIKPKQPPSHPFFSEITTLSLLVEGAEDNIPLDMTHHDANRMLLTHIDWFDHLKDIDTQNYFSGDLDPSDEETPEHSLKLKNFRIKHAQTMKILLRRNPYLLMTRLDGTVVRATSRALFNSYLHV